MRDPRMNRRMSQAPRMSVVFTPINLQDFNMADEQDGTKRASLRAFCCNHIKSVVTIIMVFGMIFCVVMIVMVHKWNYEKNEGKYVSGCLDVAVIGSGLSGAYTAWKLRNLGLDIHLFEMSDHVGGMFHTMHFNDYPDLHLDLGVTSYNPESQPHLENLIHVLQLQPHTSHQPNPDLPTFFLRNHLLTINDLKTSNTQYNLMGNERGKAPDHLQRYYLEQLLPGYWSHKDISPLILNTSDGLLLYKQGYKNALGKVGTSEGMNFLDDTVRWRHLASNDNAAQLFFAPWEHLNQTEYTQHKVLKGGMQALPIELIQQFKDASPRHRLKVNHRLECIREKHGLHQLIFIKTKLTNEGNLVDLRESEEVCSHNVILAIPPKALKQIEWSPFDGHFPYKEALNSVKEYPVMRIYFFYSNLWLGHTDIDSNYRDVYTDMPIRHFKYLGRYNHVDLDKQYYAFMVAEVEKDDLEYLNSLLELKSFDCQYIYKCSDTKYLVRDITRQIAALLNDKYNITAEAMPLPDQVIIYDWTKNTGTGSWYNWKKGVCWDNVAENMTKPEWRENVFFVGNGFCAGTCQHNVEGVLKTVDNVLAQHFNITS